MFPKKAVSPLFPINLLIFAPQSSWNDLSRRRKKKSLLHYCCVIRPKWFVFKDQLSVFNKQSREREKTSAREAQCGVELARKKRNNCGGKNVYAVDRSQSPGRDWTAQRSENVFKLSSFQSSCDRETFRGRFSYRWLRKWSVGVVSEVARFSVSHQCFTQRDQLFGFSWVLVKVALENWIHSRFVYV